MKNSFRQNSSRILAMILAASMVISLGADISSTQNVYAAESQEYTCGKTAHTHTDECYEEQEVTKTVCGQEEGDGAVEEHHHTDECYTTERTLTCEQAETESVAGHTHDESCYDEEQNLICGKEEGEGAVDGHTHDDSCYTDGEKKLTCDKEETDGVEGHTHTDDCYEITTEKVLICEQKEHEHSDACKKTTQEEPKAEPQTEPTEETVLNADYDADYLSKADDAVDSENKLASLIAVAQSQIGYTQQTKDDTDDTVYTLYGNWYDSENTYDNWAAVFAAYCLDKAGFDTERDVNGDSMAIPVAGSLFGWLSLLNDKGMILNVSDFDEDEEDSLYRYGLYAGDIAFLDLDEDDEIDHVGIVTKTDGDKYGQNISNVTVVLGGYTDDDEDIARVATRTFDNIDAVVASIPVQSIVANTPETQATYDLSSYLTGSKLQQKNGNDWVDATQVDDQTNVKVTLDYAIPKSVDLQLGDTLTYTVPSLISLDKDQTGPVTGKIGDTEYTSANPLGTYTVTKDGKVTIEFNETFYSHKGDFSGDLYFEGTASNSSTSEDKTFKFDANGTTYTVNKRKVNNDLYIDKKATHKDGSSKVTYTVEVWSLTGTDGDFKVSDTISYTGVSGNNINIGNITVKKESDGSTVNFTKSDTVSGDGTKSFDITLPQFTTRDKYIITYEVDYGEPVSTDGSSSAKNYVAVYKGEDKEGEKDVDTNLTKKMVEKSGELKDSNTTIEWTIKINQSELSNVAGEYQFTDLIKEGSGDAASIDWSEVTELRIVRKNADNTYTTATADQDADSLIANLKSGKINIADGCSYTITYKTAVPTGTAGTSTTITNKAEIEKGNKDYSDDKGITVDYADWKIKKEGNSVEPDADEQNATANWTSTITLPARSDGSTGFDGELLYQDYIQAPTNWKENSKVHWTTPALLKESLQVRLDGTAVSADQYVIKYFDADDNELTGDAIPSDDSKITRFGIKLTGPMTGTSVTISYSTRMDISDLDEGESIEVRNEAHAGGKKTSDKLKYTSPKRLIKQGGTYVSTDYGSTGKGITYKDGNFTGDQSIQYVATGGKLYYRIIVKPKTTDSFKIEDTLTNGASIDLSSVSYAPWADGEQRGDGYIDGYNINSNDHKPTVSTSTNSDGNQVITFTFPGGFPEKYTKLGNTGDANGFVIEYYADLPESFWDDLKNSNQTYTNTVSWNGKNVPQITEVKRETPVISKVGTQVDTGTGDQHNYQNRVKYYIEINPAGLTLNEGRALTLTDVLTSTGNMLAEIDMSSVKLYSYTKSTIADGDHKGHHHGTDALSDANFTFKYDDDSKKISVTVPDEQPLILEYDYMIGWNDKAEATFSNKITLEGMDKTSTSADTKITASSSGASVKKQQNKLILVKVDGQHFQTTLQGAAFYLYNSDGTRVAKTNGSELSFTTNSSGRLEVNLTEADSYSLDTDKLYYLQEETAPEGYTKTDTKYYFVFLSTAYSSGDQWWNNKGSIPEGVDKSDITFVLANDSKTIYAENRYSKLEVQKRWQDKNGNELTGDATKDMPAISVTLYRSTSKPEGVNVTINLQMWSSGSHSNTYADRTLPLFVRKGSTVTVRVPANANDGTHYTVPEGWSKAEDVDATDNKRYVIMTSPEITEAMEGKSFLITRGWDWEAYDPDNANTWKYTYTNPEYKDVDKTQVNTGTLSYPDWTASWDNLDYADSNGNIYYYTVEETVPSGYDLVSTFNNHIQSGQVVLTNRKQEVYEMPETGGTGTLPYEAAGSIAILGAMFYTGYSRRKRKGGRV